MKGEFQKRIEERAKKPELRMAPCLDMDDINEARKDVFPLPKGYIKQNNITGERDKIVLELKDWLPFINKLRKWFGDEKKVTKRMQKRLGKRWRDVIPEKKEK